MVSHIAQTRGRAASRWPREVLSSHSFALRGQPGRILGFQSLAVLRRVTVRRAAAAVRLWFSSSYLYLTDRSMGAVADMNTHRECMHARRLNRSTGAGSKVHTLTQLALSRRLRTHVGEQRSSARSHVSRLVLELQLR